MAHRELGLHTSMKWFNSSRIEISPTRHGTCVPSRTPRIFPAAPECDFTAWYSPQVKVKPDSFLRLA